MHYLSIAAWVSDGLVVFASLVGVRNFVVLALWVLIANISHHIEGWHVIQCIKYKSTAILVDSQLKYISVCSIGMESYYHNLVADLSEIFHVTHLITGAAVSYSTYSLAMT